MEEKVDYKEVYEITETNDCIKKYLKKLKPNCELKCLKALYEKNRKGNRKEKDEAFEKFLLEMKKDEDLITNNIGDLALQKICDLKGRPDYSRKNIISATNGIEDKIQRLIIRDLQKSGNKDEKYLGMVLDHLNSPSESTVRKWQEGSSNISKNRNTMVKLAFWLGLNEKEADGFLCKMTREGGFHLRDYRDFVFYFFLKNQGKFFYDSKRSLEIGKITPEKQIDSSSLYHHALWMIFEFEEAYYSELFGKDNQQNNVKKENLSRPAKKEIEQYEGEKEDYTEHYTAMLKKVLVDNAFESTEKFKSFLMSYPEKRTKNKNFEAYFDWFGFYNMTALDSFYEAIYFVLLFEKNAYEKKVQYLKTKIEKDAQLIHAVDTKNKITDILVFDGYRGTSINIEPENVFKISKLYGSYQEDMEKLIKSIEEKNTEKKVNICERILGKTRKRTNEKYLKEMTVYLSESTVRLLKNMKKANGEESFILNEGINITGLELWFEIEDYLKEPWSRKETLENEEEVEIIQKLKEYVFCLKLMSDKKTLMNQIFSFYFNKEIKFKYSIPSKIGTVITRELLIYALILELGDIGDGSEDLEEFKSRVHGMDESLKKAGMAELDYRSNFDLLIFATLNVKNQKDLGETYAERFRCLNKEILGS